MVAVGPMAAGAVATFTTIQQCTLVLNNPLTHASLCSFVCVFI